MADTGDSVEASAAAADAGSWQRDLYLLLKRKGFEQFCYVPDAGHRDLIERANADPGVWAVPLTNEAEGPGIVAGAHLGGQKAVLLMQSSGVGNCINQLSLISHGRFPFLTLVTMRGDFGEQNPWQYPMGRAVEAVLHAMNLMTIRVEREEDVLITVDRACDMVDPGGQAVAVLLTQRLIKPKAF